MKYALTYREVIAILMQRHVMVDGKVRTDKTYPAGFMGMSNCHLCHCSLKESLRESWKELFLLHFLSPMRLLVILFSILYLFLQTSCQFQRQTKTSGCCMIRKVAFGFTLSRMTRQRLFYSLFFACVFPLYLLICEIFVNASILFQVLVCNFLQAFIKT